MVRWLFRKDDRALLLVFESPEELEEYMNRMMTVIDGHRDIHLEDKEGNVVLDIRADER